MKSTTRSSAQVRDSAAMVVSPGGRSDVSMEIPPQRPTKSADMHFPKTGDVGVNVSSEGHVELPLTHGFGSLSGLCREYRL